MYHPHVRKTDAIVKKLLFILPINYEFIFIAETISFINLFYKAVQPPIDLPTPIDDSVDEMFEQIVSTLSENAPAISIVTALAALTPPPVPTLIPQGLPQPGGFGLPGAASGTGGGGILPATALTVRVLL